MTMPEERTRSIRRAAVLLEELMNSNTYPDLPDEVRQHARTIARHFPTPGELETMIEKDHIASSVLYPPMLAK